jgi:glycine cleavage system H lipoate-binding protein
MVVFLVVVTLLLCVLVDWLIRGGEKSGVESSTTARGECSPIELSDPVYVGGFLIQNEMAFHPGHAWAFTEGPARVRIGMDDFAAKLLGRIDDIDLPKIGDTVVQGLPVWTVKHAHRQTPMLSPVTGKVVAVNTRLEKGRDVIGRAPYSDGWLLSVQTLDLRANLNNLIRGDLLHKWLEVIAIRLRTRLSPGHTVSFNDGGTAIDDICALVDDDEWKNIAKEFLHTEP